MRSFTTFIREDDAKKKAPTNVDKVKDQQDYANAKAKRAQLIQLQKAQQDDLRDKQKDDLKKAAEKDQQKRLGLKNEEDEDATDDEEPGDLKEATEIASLVASAKASAFKNTSGTLVNALRTVSHSLEKDSDALRARVARLTNDIGGDDSDMSMWEEATEAEQLARALDASASNLNKIAQQIDSGRYDWQTHHALANALEVMVALKKTIA